MRFKQGRVYIDGANNCTEHRAMGNDACDVQERAGNRKKMKKISRYHHRQLAETAIYWLKQLLTGTFSMRRFNC